MAILVSLGLLAFGRHLFGGYRCSVIAPGTAFVVNDVGNVAVAERIAERGHWARVNDATYVGALQAMQHGADMDGRIGVVDRCVALERWECTGQAFAIALMASRAIGGEKRLALGRIVTARRGHSTAGWASSQHSGGGRRHT